MTIRKLFERRKRWITIVQLVSFLLFAAGGLLASWLNVSPAFFIIPFFAFFIISLFYLQLFAFRCPRCEENLGQLGMRGNFLGVGRNVCYCPFCGVGLDAEIDPESHQRTEFLKKWEQGGAEAKKTNIQHPDGIQKETTDIRFPPAEEE